MKALVRIAAIAIAGAGLYYAGLLNSIIQTRLGPDYFYDFLNLGFKMTASSGEDMPYTGVLSASRLYAFCGTNQPFNPDLWFDAVLRIRQ